VCENLLPRPRFGDERDLPPSSVRLTHRLPDRTPCPAGAYAQ
jgi:hypothetical protein